LDDSAEHIEFEEAIKGMDILMLLRVQHERHEDKDSNQPTNEILVQNGKKFDINEYSKNFGINEKHLDKMKDNAIIMHPAPFNRGIELANEIVECTKSRIFQQMSN
jgi:aspartate carbamoyltransferase catalytic subunit